jgi:sec-independent protein translocase protein TatB
MFGITIEKLIFIGVLAAVIIGPARLPKYAAQLARLVRGLRSIADSAKDRIRDEMGPEFDDLDWRKMDPRQYDPRRIIREALLDDAPAREAEPVTVQPLEAERVATDPVLADTTGPARE